MAYQTVTVSTMVSRVSHMLSNNATADSNLSTEIKWALEDNVNRLAFKADLAAFRKEATVNTATNTTDYELPIDFYRMIEPGVKFAADPLWSLEWYDQQDFDRYDGDWRLQNASRPRMYTVRGRDETSGRYILRVHPKPDQSYLLKMPYFSVPARIATAADSDLIDKRFPPMFWRTIQFGAALDFPQYLSAQQDNTYKQKYSEGLLLIQQTSQPVSGRIHQNRRYHPTRGGSSATWDMSGTDLLGPTGATI